MSMPPPSANHRNDPPDLGAAARALTDAAAALARALGRGVTEVSPHISEAVSVGLREAAESLNTASDGVKAKTSAFSAASRANKAAQTRQDLLAAAAKVIAAKGYAGASVEEIGAVAGYTKGAVYTHFASKSDLFAALAIDHLATSQPLPGRGQLADQIAASLRAQTEPSGILLTLEILGLAIRDSDFRAEVGPAWEQALNQVSAQIAADRGLTEPPGQSELDCAIGLVALINTARALAWVGIPATTSQTTPALSPTEITCRLVAQLLR